MSLLFFYLLYLPYLFFSFFLVLVKSKEEYVRALEARLKEAIERIEKHKLSLKKICSGPHGKFLTSQSKLDRSEMIMRIKSTRELLHTVLENLRVEHDENDATARKK